MLCTFYYDVVTAVYQLLINEYVMLCYVMLWWALVSFIVDSENIESCYFSWVQHRTRQWAVGGWLCIGLFDHIWSGYDHMTMTFELLTSKSNQFIFVSKCTKIVILVYFPSGLWNIVFVGRTEVDGQQLENIMPPQSTTYGGRRHKTNCFCTLQCLL